MSARYSSAMHLMCVPCEANPTKHMSCVHRSQTIPLLIGVYRSIHAATTMPNTATMSAHTPSENFPISTPSCFVRGIVA